MSSRAKTTLLIIMIVFVVTATNFLAARYFTNHTLKKTLEQDLAFAIGIVNDLVGVRFYSDSCLRNPLLGAFRKIAKSDY